MKTHVKMLFSVVVFLSIICEKRQREHRKKYIERKPGRSRWTKLLSSQNWWWHWVPTREACKPMIPTCSNSVSHPQTLSSYPSTCSRNPLHRTYKTKIVITPTNKTHHTQMSNTSNIFQN